MPLEKYEHFLELSVKQFNTVKSNLPWSDNVWCVKKPNINVVSSEVS